MAVSTGNVSLSGLPSGLPRRLVRDKLISQGAALEAVAVAKQSKESFVSVVINHYGVAANDLAHAAGQEFGLPTFDLNTFDLENLPKEQLNEELITKHHALPLSQRGSRLYIGISDPTNIAGLDEFKLRAELSTEPVLVEDDKLQASINQALTLAGTDFDEDLDEDLDNLDVSNDGGTPQQADTSEIDETPVVRFVKKVLLDGIKRGASDIHMEPYEKTFRIRYRIDGVLEQVASPPPAMAARITARVKVMSKMDIAERRIPQDGRLQMKITQTRNIDIRVNTCPTLFGEKIVLRILDPASTQLGIEMLGYEDNQKELYLKALHSPYGMILVTGPTGSGKTVSLYTGLNILNDPKTNISTAEDPAEIDLPGINQVNVNTKVGLTFSEALRSFLRQDPDVIMVGEIRDLDTASIAVKAAQTGHLVLSTLHTNDAPQTLTRLVNMGIPPLNIATSVTLIIAQRLGRRLCEGCKTLHDFPHEALVEEGFHASELSDLEIYQAVGCNQCSNGYKGRVGVYQVMPVTEEIGEIIMSGGNALKIAEQARKDGVADLRESALKKVKDGVLSLEEANRITKD